MSIDNSTQKYKARNLLSLHTQTALMVLPNTWSPIGARVLQAKGYPDVATASAAISASLGYQDGEKLKRSTFIDLIGRIARSVDVPVTADIAETLLNQGDSSCFSDMLSKEETMEYLPDGKE